MGYILSTAVVLFLVMDPLGNMPFFIASLSGVPKPRWKLVIFRELCIALAVLCSFLLCGKYALAILSISQSSVGIAGGVILFLIALKMVFQTNSPENVSTSEPFIVPLAVPMIAGPSALATIILAQGSPHASLFYCFIAVLAAWVAVTLILIFSDKLAVLLGNRTLDAGQSLMGLLLAAIAVEMLIRGIKLAFFTSA